MTHEKQIKRELRNRILSIAEIFNRTGILQPSIRRILGEGTICGKFVRVSRGVYSLGDVVIIQADSIDTLPKLAEQGFKANFVFLDIPYYTPAVRGGNRGVKFPGIQPDQFQIITDALYKIVEDPHTPIVYMYSKAPSGIKKMKEYNNCLTNSGFKIACKGNYYKYYKDGMSRVYNMRGDLVLPEGILVLSKSGKLKKLSPLKLNFHCVRPRGYPTEKASIVVSAFVSRLTKIGHTILDPFVGSGVSLAVAKKLKRRALGIEIMEDAITNFVIPKLEGVI